MVLYGCDRGGTERRIKCGSGGIYICPPPPLSMPTTINQHDPKQQPSTTDPLYLSRILHVFEECISVAVIRYLSK